MNSDPKNQSNTKPSLSSASSSDESPEKPMKNSKKSIPRKDSSENQSPAPSKTQKPKKRSSSSSSSSSENSKEDTPKPQSKKNPKKNVKFVKISRLKDSLRPYIQYEDDEAEPEEEKLFTKLTLSIEKFREGIIGRNVLYESPFGGKIITLYADDTASGRPHDIVENYIRSILPIYANTHSDNSYFPVSMHLIYKDSIKYMKDIFKAPKNYELIGVGTGCTGAIFRFQEILLQKYGELLENNKENPPVCLVTEYEHHSNLLSWQKYGFEVLPIKHTARNSWTKGLKNLEQQLLSKLQSPLIVIALSAASNVTSQITPLSQVADFLQKFKQNNKTPPIIWLLDLAAYVPHARLNIAELKVDAVVISPHKLTGGPGSCGILIFNADHYNIKAPPTHPAGGTVSIVHNYNKEDVVFADDILERESAGTPGILQLIRAKEAFALQDKIGLGYIESREKQLKEKLFDSVREMNRKWEKKCGCQIEILGTHKVEERSSVFSVVFFDSKGKIYHYHLIQRILNDIFGIQLRSGCNCAGPFGVKLLEKIFKLKENMPHIIEEVKKGNAGIKPGWVRFNVHYSFTDEDMDYLIFALKFVTENGRKIANQYYEETNGDYHINSQKRYALNPDLNQLDENSLKRIEVKEIKEAKRNNYLKKIMSCVTEFLKY